MSFSEVIVIFIWAASDLLKTPKNKGAAGTGGSRKKFTAFSWGHISNTCSLYLLFALDGWGKDFTDTSLPCFYPFPLLGPIYTWPKKSNHLPVLYTQIFPLIISFGKKKRQKWKVLETRNCLETRNHTIIV